MPRKLFYEQVFAAVASRYSPFGEVCNASPITLAARCHAHGREEAARALDEMARRQRGEV